MIGVRVMLVTLMCCGLLALMPRASEAQAVRREVIVGVVRDSAGGAVTSGDVIVTAAQSFAVTSGLIANGRFRVVVDSGTGDFLVMVSAPGYLAARQRATLSAREDSVVLTFVLSRAGATALTTVSVSARRPQARDLNVSVGARGGAQEQITSETVGALGPGEAGDLTAAAALNPALTTAAGGVGALGLGPEQSRITINGQTSLGSVMPRDMRRRVRAGTTNFDPAIGGFSAALVSVELLRGSSLTQPVVRVSQEGEGQAFVLPSAVAVTGPRSVVSYASSGEALPGAVYYNFGGTLTLQTTESQRFGNTASAALTASGVTPVAAQRALAAANTQGVPLDAQSSAREVGGVGTVLGRIDWLKTRWGPLALTAGGSVTRPAALLTALDNGTRRLQSASTSASLQLSSTRQTSGGWLLDWRIGGQALATHDRPKVSGPAVLVQMPSDSSTAVFAGFGGSGQAVEASVRSVVDAAWQAERIVALPGRGTHQVKLFAQQQSDFLQRRTDQSSGVFRFATLDAWERGEPASYDRVLTGATRHVSAANVAVGVGDVWRPSRFLLLQLGLRADVGGALQPVRPETSLSRALAIPTALTGTRFQPLLSPRLGFSWTYRQQRAESPSLLSTGSFGTVAFPGNGTLRGGVGLFRTYWNVDELLTTTGLSTANRLTALSCGSGSFPTWQWFATTDAAPEACGLGDGQRTTFVTGTLLPARAVTPAAWRGNLTLSHGLTKKVTVELGGELSYGIHQRTLVDRNLPAEARSSLPFEGGRESALATLAIDPATGIARVPTERPVPGVGPVLDLTTDGRNRAARLSLAILPEPWHHWLLRFQSSFLTASRYGSDYLATGLTRSSAFAWTPTEQQPRARTVLEVGRLGGRVAVGGLLVHEAGARFTPLVSGDINGDGASQNDRAFIDRATLSNPVLQAFPRAVQQCLQAQPMRIAGVASCPAPARLRADLSLTVAPDPSALTRRGGGRLTYAFRVTNVPALLDQLVHRSPRGWGSASNVDPVLLAVRGYDPAIAQYRYALNSNFGRPLLGGVTRRAPYLLSVDVRLFLGGSVADQEASRTLKSSRLGGERPRSVDDIVARLRSTFADPYAATLEAGDTLLLQRAQVEAIQRVQAPVLAAVDSVWRAAAVRLAARDLSAADAGALLQLTYTEVIRRLRTGVQPLRTILTAPQLQRVPSEVAALLAGKDPLYRLR